MHDLAAVVDEVHPGFKRIHHRFEDTGVASSAINRSAVESGREARCLQNP